MKKTKVAKSTRTPTQFTGKFVGTAKGFGFVAPENAGADDIFIPPHFVCGALHGDVVEVKTETDTRFSAFSDEPDNKLRQLGRITQILNRNAYVGTYYTVGAQGYVKPIEPKIPYIFAVPPKSRNRFGLADGHRVVFSVDKRSRPEDVLTSVFITEVLGHANDPGVDVLTLVRQAGIPYEWPADVLEETENILDNTHINGSHPARLDLRTWQICTIDGDDTKDIDDAISLTLTDAGYFKLGVHIADVAHYVVEKSPLDREALRRGTSVYLADRVIPMLPHRLSSGICSLFPNVDRLALSCLMTVDENGSVLDYEIRETLINSKRRWTYNEVENILEREATERNKTPEREATKINESLAYNEKNWLPFFANLDRLRAILWNKRRKRGALDFDLPEAKIRVDETGRPISIEPYSRNRATAIIEECMILCNETVAAHRLAKKIPLPYRTHEPPNALKLVQLQRAAQNYGIKIPPLAAKPKVLQKVLDSVADTPAAYVISGAVLRALPQAHYTPDNPTHYGLASEAYCHFTSPIRRYADLQAHRIIKNFIHGNRNEDISIPGTPQSAAPYLSTASLQSAAHFKHILPAVCAQASRTEREAEALEREVTQLKKVQFMQGYEGETFAATVSGITPWGVYVMLPSTIEGLIPIEYLRKINLRYDKERKCYVSKRNREALTPGTELTVRLVNADAEERKLIFALTLDK